MATKKISALPEVTTPAGTDVLPVVSGGVTNKVTVNNLAAAAPVVALQAATPGTAQTGHANVTGSILVGGKIGIGTSPTYTFHVHAPASTLSGMSFTNSATGTDGATRGFFFGLSTAIAYFVNRENGPMFFWTNNSCRMTILADGKVGINTLTPGSKLAVVGLPTSAAGLSAGDIWVDTTGGLNILKIV